MINQLKHAITTNEFQVNPKNGHQYVINSYCNYCFTTNNPNPIPIEPSDRRFVAFYCSSVMKHNTGHWDRLWAAIKVRECIKFQLPRTGLIPPPTGPPRRKGLLPVPHEGGLECIRLRRKHADVQAHH